MDLPGAPSLAIKGSSDETDHPPPSSAKIKNALSSASTTQHASITCKETLTTLHYSDNENYTGQYQLLQLAKTEANMT
jgi:hypothetical protein